MSLESKAAKKEECKTVENSNKNILESSKISPVTERECKKHVKISSHSPTAYEDESKKGVQVYTALSNSRLVGGNAIGRHTFLQNVPTNRHWKKSGTPSLAWYQYVSQLVCQRTQLTLLRKLYSQRYYTTQFLYKLHQFLGLQRLVSRDVTFYQSYTLNGETCKLPKLNILCKQIVSLLNDLDSCSMESLTKSLDRNLNLDGFIVQWQNIYEQISFDLVQCVQTIREIVLNEIRFCYLFANYRSRIYSMMSHVIKFNDIVFHPVLTGGEDHLITLEDVISCNVEVAARYIARSYHHKIVSSHSKSVPIVLCKSKISDIVSSIKKCQVCTKHGHLMHKYCTNKCGTFIDAMSLMIQGAGENRVTNRTDSCTSLYVEEELSRQLLRALYYIAGSSVFYEAPLSCGDKQFVTVHEQFCDQSRHKNRRKWDDNYTNVIYVCTQRGLPNTWTCLSDIPDFECTVYKLDTSYYSLITCNYSKKLKLAQLTTHINQGIESLIGLVKLDVVDTEINDKLTRHFNTLSYLVLSDSGPGLNLEEIQLLQKYVVHLNQVIQFLYCGYRRVVTKCVSTKDYAALFGHVTSVYELCVYLESLHKQLVVSGELKVPFFVSHSFSKALTTALSQIQLLKELPNVALEELCTSVAALIRDHFLDSSPSVSYWRKDVYGTPPSPLMVTLVELIGDISKRGNNLPEPYLTRTHHVLTNNAAQAITRHVVNNKKITFSSKGVSKLESDVQYFIDVVKTYPVSSEVVLSTADMLTLRNNLNTLVLKRRKSSTKPACSCSKEGAKEGNWKRLSAPNLCTGCPATYLKPPAVNARQIFSDSEVDADDVSLHLKMRQKKHVKERLEITM